MRIAAVCLLVSGIIVGLPAIALRARLLPSAASAVTWAAVIAVVSGVATATHGLSSLVGTDRLAQLYQGAGAATHAAIVIGQKLPSAVDPGGLATFGLAGLAALIFGAALRPGRPRLGTLGVVLGIDMVLLFIADSIGSTALVLVTGGLASVVLGPIWWVSIGRLLLAEGGG
ncbi:MAG TPA: hypothetical protein VFW71_12145 [Actinomycetota bacterium]|nr:hypothetical protein [Actinomycetota bacterium]